MWTSKRTLVVAMATGATVVSLAIAVGASGAEGLGRQRHR
jgi:hypothetical protein